MLNRNSERKTAQHDGRDGGGGRDRADGAQTGSADERKIINRWPHPALITPAKENCPTLRFYVDYDGSFIS
jgi:hypothetical protein